MPVSIYEGVHTFFLHTYMKAMPSIIETERHSRSVLQTIPCFDQMGKRLRDGNELPITTNDKIIIVTIYCFYIIFIHIEYY